MSEHKEPAEKESEMPSGSKNQDFEDNSRLKPVEQSTSEESEQTDSDALQEPNLEQQIERLQVQLSQAEEDVLRAKAQEQNALRRASLDVEKARKFALESFVKELLPVVDNLERALASVEPEQQTGEAFVEGVELTLKSFLAALEKSRIKAIDPTDESFNPDQHQAMASVENNEVEPNTVIEVFQKGYELNGRLIRPAMVVVSKSS